MHKGVMLIVEATDKEFAIDKAREFMSTYQDNVFDWYVIGGRWSGTLNKNSKKFFKEVESILKEDGNFISTKVVEKKEPYLQEVWRSYGELNVNPYNRDTYNNDGYDDDALPLVDCLDIVKSWELNPETECEKYMELANEEKGSMKGYYLKLAGEALMDCFTFESNIHNCEEGNGRIPKEKLEDYYVVMIDMHN